MGQYLPWIPDQDHKGARHVPFQVCTYVFPDIVLNKLQLDFLVASGITCSFFSLQRLQIGLDFGRVKEEKKRS